MYQRPGGIVKLFNSAAGWFASMGIGPSRTVVIEVKGRKSGQPRTATINTVDVDDTDYLVAPRGQTEWVRNVRASGGEATLRRGGKERRVRLAELAEGERAPVIQKYLKENAMATKASFGISPDAPIEEFRRIAPSHPVFRVTDA